MPAPPTPPIEQELDGRLFAFYPPIRNIEYNEWQYLRSTWSELLVANGKAGVEVWIPRRHFGAISSVDQPMPIVGLSKELEYRAGSVFPFRTKLLEMPKELPERPERAAAKISGVASVSRVGTGHKNEGSVFKLIGIVLLVALLSVFATVAIFRGGLFESRALLPTKDQDYLSLSGADDYAVIVRRLGKPASDRWNARSKEVVFRALDYPSRAYTVILFGADRSSARYIGTMDGNWRPIHSVSGRGTDYSAMLRTLPRF
ncbi:MAG: hypothetical protein U5J83_07320 [Bryobacterales bacterium]|nr:hypothetical protein [Bryobacterales bacterium]